MHLSFVAVQAIMGFGFLIFLAFCFSEDKKAINWKLILTAFIVQNVLFLLIRYVPFINHVLTYFSQMLLNLLEYASAGAKFIFGDFADKSKYGFVFLIVI